MSASFGENILIRSSASRGEDWADWSVQTVVDDSGRRSMLITIIRRKKLGEESLSKGSLGDHWVEHHSRPSDHCYGRSPIAAL